MIGLVLVCGCETPRSQSLTITEEGVEAKDNEARALERFRKAISVYPENHRAHALLGATLTDARKPQEALEALDKALELRPNHAEYLYQRARALRLMAFQQGTRDGQEYERIAAQVLLAVLEQDPCHSEALLMYGALAEAQDERLEAMDAYGNALRCDPKQVVAARRLTWLYRDAGLAPRAEAVARLGLDARQDPELRLLLGGALFAQGRYKDADETLSPVLRAIAAGEVEVTEGAARRVDASGTRRAGVAAPGEVAERRERGQDTAGDREPQEPGRGRDADRRPPPGRADRRAAPRGALMSGRSRETVRARRGGWAGVALNSCEQSLGRATTRRCA